MEYNDIMQQVCRVLHDDFEIESALLQPNALLQKDIGLDSLDWVDLIVAIYEEFGFKPSQEELKDIKTLDDLCTFIARHNV